MATATERIQFGPQKNNPTLYWEFDKKWGRIFSIYTNTNIVVQKTVEAELKKLRKLKENWDGYGGSPIDSQIIAATKEMIKNLIKLNPQASFPAPHVVPGSAGNLQLEWFNDQKSLEIEIEDPETVHYLRCGEDEGIEEEDIFPISETNRILQLIKWFKGEVVRA